MILIMVMKRGEGGIKFKRNKWCTEQFLSIHWPVPCPSLSSDCQLTANSPHLCTGHDTIWYGISFWLLQVICPGHGSSWPLVPLLPQRAWEPEQSSRLCKHTLATTETSMCYQHYTHAKFQTQPVLATKKQITSILAENRTLYSTGFSTVPIYC